MSRSLLIFACCIAVSNLSIESANGQFEPANPPTKAASDDDEKKPPGPEVVTLETKDKVQLVCTYFPPTPQTPPAAAKGDAAADTKTEPQSVDGKRVIPYIILHDWKSSRADTQVLANFLSAQGNAVITPDLRGHGESTQVAGFDRPVNFADFKSNEINATLEDVEACKRFLVKKNNAGELNIDMLSLIAIGKTVPLAAQWVVHDWTSYQPYNKQGIKQAQDAKFLIMISPEKKLGSFSTKRSISAPLFSGQNALPAIVVWGTSSNSAKDSQSIYNMLNKQRPNSENASADTKTLFRAPLGTSASGGAIAADTNGTKLFEYFDKTVSGMMDRNLDKLPWQDRTSRE